MTSDTKKEAIQYFGLDKYKFEQKLRESGMNPTMEEIESMIEEMNQDAHMDKKEEMSSKENDVITQNLIDALHVFQDEPIISKTEFQKIINYGNKKKPILDDEEQKSILSDVQNTFSWEKYVKKYLSKSEFIHSLKVD